MQLATASALPLATLQDYEAILNNLDEIIRTWRGCASAGVSDHIWLSMRFRLLRQIGAWTLLLSLNNSRSSNSNSNNNAGNGENNDNNNINNIILPNGPADITISPLFDFFDLQLELTVLLWGESFFRSESGISGEGLGSGAGSGTSEDAVVANLEAGLMAQLITQLLDIKHLVIYIVQSLQPSVST